MCSLFKSDAIKTNSAGSVQPVKQAAGVEFLSEASFEPSAELSAIEGAIGNLREGRSVWFKTDGAWSNYHLLEYILKISGPAQVYFTTWSISEVAITKFLAWKASGRIIDLHAVIDVGLRNRKPAIYQQAVQAFPNLKVAHCHAKATVVISATHQITFIGSANYTRNPRKEVGVIIWDESIAQENKHWIEEEIYGAQ